MLSELGVGYVLKRVAPGVPFRSGSLTAHPDYPWEGDIQPAVGPWTISATYPGLERFISIALKSWLSMQAAIVLAASTPFPDLLVAMRAMGCHAYWYPSLG